MGNPLVSIVMPTYNSGNTIYRALQSVRLQTMPVDLVEIIIADGGSTDNTLDIAAGFGCRIISNERVQPEFGKLVGLNAAKGRYAVFLDSDEVLVDPESLEKKAALLSRASGARNVITAGLTNPPGYPVLNDYVNRFGEPFSYFMYGLDGGDYVASLRRRYRVRFEDDIAMVVEFGERDVLPICDGGGHFFDLEFLRQIADINDITVIPMVFSLMAEKTRALGVVKGDFTEHYSAVSLRRYLNKIRWRIRSNVHRFSGTEGYANREGRETNAFRLRKYLFIPYAISFVLPLADAIRMSVARRHPWYLMHLPLSIYTALNIMAEMALKGLGVRPHLRAYGE